MHTAYESERVGPIYLIRLHGEFDELAAAAFREQVEAAFAQSVAHHLLVDMQRVTFIDSSGLGALFGRYKMIKARGGEMRIIVSDGHVRQLLELAGVPRLMTLHRNEQDALLAFEGVARR